MDRKKFTILFFVISVGLLGVYSLMNSISKTNQQGGDGTPSLEGEALNSDGSLSDGGTGQNNGVSGNFTDLFGSILAQQLINQNSLDPGQTMGVDGILSDQAIKDFTHPYLSAAEKSTALHPMVYSAHYTISDDTSKDAQIKYLNQIKEIAVRKTKEGGNKTSAEVLASVGSTKNGAAAVAMAGVYRGIADEYSRMTVPKNWVEFHKGLLSHFYSAQSVYMAISDINNDPMKTTIALQLLPEIDKSSDSLRILVADGMKKNNLHF